MTVFFRVLGAAPSEKAAALLDAIRIPGGSEAFVHSVERFSRLPGCPFAYWMSESALELFVRAPSLGTPRRFARVGMGTLDNFQFLRLWYEVPEKRHWIPYANGGRFVRFLADTRLAVNWGAGGKLIKVFVEQRVGSASRKVQSESLFLREGVTWPLRASAFCPQVLPSGCIFSARGQTLFAESREELLALVALGSSAAFDFLFKVMLGRFGFPEFLAGGLERMPLPPLSAEQVARLERLARRGWRRAWQKASCDETQQWFVLPTSPFVREGEATAESDAGELQAEIDSIGLEVFGLSPDDLAGTQTVENDSESQSLGEEAEEADSSVEMGTDESIGSWLVGVSFARFDPRLATGERPIPPEPEPFVPVFTRSPGMYPEGEEPADRPDILVDDEGHSDDLATRALATAERVSANVPESLRGWLAKEFFPLHIKMYSKSRRKAPIYWQLATPSVSYSVWLYIHAFTKDTLFRVQDDYVSPKLAHEERRLESLADDLREGATAAQRKQLAAQEALVEELRGLLEEVKRVAPLWNPSLDDGVIINFAPLWRLVPQNKSWQKELKATWDALCEGDYDWAHLAMHLWPERVVPKCAQDRSLAIAHGLEEVFWVEDADGKWTARKKPTRPVAELVHERTSSAVKAALKSLLEAPVATGGTGRGRGGRKRGASVADREGR